MKPGLIPGFIFTKYNPFYRFILKYYYNGLVPKLLTTSDVNKIKNLRQTGHSLPEIKRLTGFANATIQKYISGVRVHDDYVQKLKDKQGGSKKRAEIAWLEARGCVEKMVIPPFTKREILMVTAALYWGEGTKNELNIINSDPGLLRLFVKGILSFGVPRDQLRASVRIYGNAEPQVMIRHWSKLIGVSESQFIGFERVKKSGESKFPYGMCRVRVSKGAIYFKQLMSMIDLLRTKM